MASFDAGQRVRIKEAVGELPDSWTGREAVVVEQAPRDQGLLVRFDDEPTRTYVVGENAVQDKIGDCRPIRRRVACGESTSRCISC